MPKKKSGAAKATAASPEEGQCNSSAIAEHQTTTSVAPVATPAAVATTVPPSEKTFSAASGKHFVIVQEEYPEDVSLIDPALRGEVVTAAEGDLLELMSMHGDWGYGKRFKERAGSVNEGVFRLEWVYGVKLILEDGKRTPVEVDIDDPAYGFRELRGTDTTAKLRIKRYRKKLEDAARCWSKITAPVVKLDKLEAAAAKAAAILEKEDEEEKVRQQKIKDRRDAAELEEAERREAIAEEVRRRKAAVEEAKRQAALEEETRRRAIVVEEVRRRKAEAEAAAIEEARRHKAEVEEARKKAALEAEEAAEEARRLAAEAEKARKAEAEAAEEARRHAAEAKEARKAEAEAAEEARRRRSEAEEAHWRRQAHSRAAADAGDEEDSADDDGDADDDDDEDSDESPDSPEFAAESPHLKRRFEAPQRGAAASLVPRSCHAGPMQPRRSSARDAAWQAQWEQQAANLERVLSESSSGVESSDGVGRRRRRPTVQKKITTGKFTRSLLAAKRSGELHAIVEEWEKASDLSALNEKVKRSLLGPHRVGDLERIAEEMASEAEQKAAEVRELKERVFRAMSKMKRSRDVPVDVASTPDSGDPERDMEMKERVFRAMRSMRRPRDLEKITSDMDDAQKELEMKALQLKNLMKRAWKGMLESRRSCELERIADEMTEGLQTKSEAVMNKIRKGLLRAHRAGELQDLREELDELADSVPDNLLVDIGSSARGSSLHGSRSRQTTADSTPSSTNSQRAAAGVRGGSFAPAQKRWAEYSSSESDAPPPQKLFMQAKADDID